MKKKSISPKIYYLTCSRVLKLRLKHKNNTSIEFIRPKTIGNEMLLKILEILVFYKMATAAIFDFGTIFTKKKKFSNFSLI